ncbi:hypothetical protein RND81_07G079700 [Saponaria officinalis]|uniref:Tetratricopeptide repeat protein 1 n=1 Tax=Saponaria officinalis TaxID=3572 RepID=A0AAW1JQA9_SAPOF
MVVVIEEEAEEQVLTFNNNINTDEKFAETSFVSTKDDSDGFETASEGGRSTAGGGDDDDDDDGKSQEQQREQTVVVSKDDSSGDSLTEDLIEKALSQANDAKVEGNELFKDGKFEDALLKYETALQIAPEIPKPEPAPLAAAEVPKQESTSQAATEKPKQDPAPQVAPEMMPVVELRSICHFNRAVCFLKLEKYDETIKECSKALELKPIYVKALVRRAEAFEKLERYDEAISDMEKILELDPSNNQARRNIMRLEPLAREKMEKMKEEMIGKLKELGNSVLGRFGMSVDNFKAVQDPNTGSYSLSFQR